MYTELNLVSNLINEPANNYIHHLISILNIFLVHVELQSCFIPSWEDFLSVSSLSKYRHFNNLAELNDNVYQVKMIICGIWFFFFSPIC